MYIHVTNACQTETYTNFNSLVHSATTVFQ